jgi:hypothetical protein
VTEPPPSGLPDHGFIRQVASPLTQALLRPLDSRCRVVQFDSLLTDDDFRRLADFMRQYPDVGLRAYGSYDDSITDLDFLRFFAKLKRFYADVLELQDLRVDR